MEKTAETLKDEETKAREEAKRLEELNDKVKSKLVNYQELYDQSQRMITLGSKVDQIAERYFYMVSVALWYPNFSNSLKWKMPSANK